MDACNDPKCPLNRQGIQHEPHHIIENTPVTDPCNDPRCAMNRMGMAHNTHDGQYGQESTKPPKKDKGTHADKKLKKPEWFTDDSFEGTAGDALEELARQIHGSNPATKNKKPDEHSAPPTREERNKPRSKPPSKDKILDSADPREILGLASDATYDEIKAKYKEMVRKYDASKGMLNKSQEEKNESNRVMAKINHAYSQMRRMHKDET